MIRHEHYLDHHVGAIYVEGLHSNAGHGYFRAFAEINLDNSTPKIIRSRSGRGSFAAVANLCKRLDTRFKRSYLGMPPKWQIYLIDSRTLQQNAIISGYLTVKRNQDDHEQRFWADLYTQTFGNTSEQERDEYIRKGIVNSVADATGTTGFGALSNLCTSLHNLGVARTIDSLVLDSLAASFFLPAMNQGK